MDGFLHFDLYPPIIAVVHFISPPSFVVAPQGAITIPSWSTPTTFLFVFPVWTHDSLSPMTSLYRTDTARARRVSDKGTRPRPDLARPGLSTHHLIPTPRDRHHLPSFVLCHSSLAYSQTQVSFLVLLNLVVLVPLFLLHVVPIPTPPIPDLRDMSCVCASTLVFSLVFEVGSLTVPSFLARNANAKNSNNSSIENTRTDSPLKREKKVSPSSPPQEHRRHGWENQE